MSTGPNLRDHNLTQLSRIRDVASRTDQTLAYLRTLPPWPEPLPWEVELGRTANSEPLPAPKPKGGLPLHVRDGLLELIATPHSEDDDPLRTKSYARLQQVVTALVRHGNRYPELIPVVNGLLEQTAGSLAEASLFDIHLDVGALTDLMERNDARSEAERIDPDCLTAMTAVIRVGPPLTINDPLVIEFEAAHARYANRVADETVRAGERVMGDALAKGGDGVSQSVQDFASMLAAQPHREGRVEIARGLLTKDSVVRVGLYLGGVSATALVGLVTVEGAKAAWASAPELWTLLASNKDAIMAAAWGWGDQAQMWTADLLARAVEISRLKDGSPRDNGK